MNDKTRAGLSVIIVATLGIAATICGMVEHWEAMDCGDVFQYTDGAIHMIFGCLFILISLIMKIWIEGFMKIKELQKEREDLLEKMEDMKTSNRIFDGRTEAFREDIIVLRDRMDYLEDRMQKESYSHDIEDEVF